MKGLITPGFKSMLYNIRTVLPILAAFLISPVFAQDKGFDKDDPAREIIARAIVAAGGGDWDSLNTLVAHESQTRNTDKGVVQLELDHTMDTKGHGYRMEITGDGSHRIYGWDGKQFWANVDGKPGDEAQVKEARRLISDAFYRFSMPFILGNRNSTREYVGEDMVNGKPTKVVKITYQGNPVDGYWKTAEMRAEEHGHNQHDNKQAEAKADEHAGHSGDAGKEAAKHEGHGDHHDGAQVYFYHFDEDDRIAKIYFSHHGDDSYETFLFSDYTTVNGITREQSRKLLEADGKTLYDTRFSRVEFRTDSNTELYSPSHH